MINKIILDMKILHYHTFDGQKYGDLYVRTRDEGEFYVFINDDKMYIMRHFLCEDAAECICKPPKIIEDAIWKELEEIFK